MAGLMLCLTFYTLFATDESLTGMVKDDTGSPVEFATVALLAASDSTLIDGGVTDADGCFNFHSPNRACYLRISAIGYEEKYIADPRGELGEISLIPVAYELGEVVVKGSRPAAKLTTDGVQVAIAGTYLATSGTAADVLGKMPFVSKNGSELEVVGKGSPVVYINGRQVRDQSELDRLGSAEIKSVDVVTSPGARYDSSVKAVIRITTVAPVGEGFSFNDRTTIGYKHYVYLFEQVNLNLRKNGFDLFGMLNYENYRERPAYDNQTVQYLPSGTVGTSVCGRDVARYPVYQGKIGLNYIKAGHSAGIYYDFSYRPASIGNSTFTTRLIDRILEDELDYRGNTSRRNRQHLLSGYYTGEMGRWRLSANIDGMWQINGRNTMEYEASAVNPVREFSTDNDVTNRLLAGNVTAAVPVWKGELRFGSEVSDIRRSDLYLADVDFISGNDTRIHETTVALFAETKQTFGRLTATAGLRWEFTDSRYYSFGEKVNDQSRDYHNFAPNIAVGLPIGNVSATLSYTRKISRPEFGQLSSAIRYIDRYSYESGNPGLKPIFRDYVSLSGGWKDIVVELTWYSTKNYFMWQTFPYPGNPDATLLKMENMPRFNTVEAFVNYSPTFFDIWRPSFMAGIMSQHFSLNHNGEEIALNKPLGILRFNNAIHLPGDIWLNVDFSGQTSGNSENMFIKGHWHCDAGLYKSFASDRWSLKLQLNDIFASTRNQMTVYDAISSSCLIKHYDTRDLSVTLRYNFNQSRSRYQGRGAANAEKSRF